METNYDLNAKLQQKKNALRKVLAEKGILQKGSTNDYDHYKYFSEAQYKKLFTELFSMHGLELTTSITDVKEFSGTTKMPFGRIITMMITLTDSETGWSESSYSIGEGIDKGDKSIYKAMTGALKYYFANTFIVATGDDPETESGDGEPANITKDDIAIIQKAYKEKLEDLLLSKNLKSIEEMSYKDGKELVAKLKEIAKNKLQ